MMVFNNKFKLKLCVSLIILILIFFGSGWLDTKAVCSSESGEIEDKRQTNEKFNVVVIPVEDTITVGTTNFLGSRLEKAIEGEADAVVIRLKTPGGLVDATMDIIEKMLNSPVPIITYVYPSGAIAASAGSLIMSAGHIAAMAPGTTVGAAMPVTMAPTGDEPQEADEKTVNFLAEYAESIARERNRPEDIARRFVTENLTLSDQTAKEKGFIDIRSASMGQLLNEIDGENIIVNGEEVTLKTADAEITKFEMTFQERFTHFLSNPQVAFLLFLLGLYGIIFGLNMPGTFIPEIGGAVALILALFGLGMFEVNTLGIILIILSVAFFIIEIFTPTFGIMTTIGVIILVLGGLMLPFEPMLPERWFKAFRFTVIGMGAATGGFFFFVIAKVVRLRKKESLLDKHGMSGYKGTVIKDLDPEGLVKIRGEIWRAKSNKDEKIFEDDEVVVVDQEGIALIVESVNEENEGKNS